MTNREGSHWLIQIPTIVHLCVTRPSEIFVKIVLSIFTVLVFTQSVVNLFHSFIVLCVNTQTKQVVTTLSSYTAEVFDL